MVSGELDLASVPHFRSAAERVCRSDAHRVVLDLRPLSFIDVTGMRAVLELHANCSRQGLRLEIRPGPRAVQRVFELTGTDAFLPFRRVSR